MKNDSFELLILGPIAGFLAGVGLVLYMAMEPVRQLNIELNKTRYQLRVRQ